MKPRTVSMQQSASAPPSTAPRATLTRSVTFGVILTITGVFFFFRPQNGLRRRAHQLPVGCGDRIAGLFALVGNAVLALRTGHAAFDHVRPGLLEPVHQLDPFVLASRHDAADEAAVGIKLLEIGDVLLDLLDRALRDQIDVIKRKLRLARVGKPRHIRLGQLRAVLRKRGSLEDDAAPARLKRPAHLSRLSEDGDAATVNGFSNGTPAKFIFRSMMLRLLFIRAICNISVC